jgi:beta-galactosidase
MNKRNFLLLLFSLFAVSLWSQRERYNFDMDWHYVMCDTSANAFFNNNSIKDKGKSVSVPRAFNEDKAFKVRCNDLPDSVAWYYKTFRIAEKENGKKIFIEFEGVRQSAEVYLNGHYVGLSENGVMAFGFDLTPYILWGKDNEIAVRVDNNWEYREKKTKSTFEWNNRNFYANYGGISKHVILHITDRIYQTLPLYSNLGTTGVYVYPSSMDVKAHKAVVNVESEIKNETGKNQNVRYEVEVYDINNKSITKFSSKDTSVDAGKTKTIKASTNLNDVHFWSWGYGYLYTVKTRLIVDGTSVDEVITHTGFRKTHFSDGKIWLNDRVLMMKGFAQRTTNEWPAVGLSVPAWLSDYSNGLMVKGSANFVRWMHVTPWKQDVESCDRVGLIESMPAGDAEKDAKGRQWEQRMELMRDAIVYNRNNPSILFYECGNSGITREHMIAMKGIRDEYDPSGGRAIGCREMLDIDEAEYGGEMLYINKSAKHPLWAMEYCRDEALRKYWDDYSYPFHKSGDGPLYRGKDASDYNRNQDMLAVEHVRRWSDYWNARPGMGKRVSSGGAKIVFSDTNTHSRGEANYRTSGVVDAMRIPKDSYFVHQVMWNGWVDTEKEQTYIIGHWNYKVGVVKPVYVVSTAPRVELFLNGKSLGTGRCEYKFLHTFDKVAFQPGELKAVGLSSTGQKISECTIRTAAEPIALHLSMQTSPKGFHADGSDMALIQVEVVDKNGQRCPLDNRKIHFKLDGPAEWRGGIAMGKDNYILSKDLPVECGVNRALVRSTRNSGRIKLAVEADGLSADSISWEAENVENKDGLSTYFAAADQSSILDRGETPLTPSYTDKKITVAIKGAKVAANDVMATNSYDDNESTEWKSDGKLANAWITYELAEKTIVNEVSLKLMGWRSKSYPLEIYADDTLVWSGETEPSLGYVYLTLKPIKASKITIRLKGSAKDNDAFGQIVEVAAKSANRMDRGEQQDKKEAYLRIVEVDFLKDIK